MNYKIIQPKDFKTTEWSGGTTTELYIYPESCNFKDRDFEFRISTATIDIEETVFSPLQGFDRTFMLLEGEVELSHKNHHSKKIKAFEQDQFKGDWITSSKGKGRPLNLITKGCTGKMRTITRTTRLNGSDRFICIYSPLGKMMVNGKLLNDNELAILEDVHEIDIRTQEKGIFIEISN